MESKKVLFAATVVRLHINLFHQPYLRWFHEQGWQVDVAANNDYDNPEDCVIPYCDHFYCMPFERSPYRTGNLKAWAQMKRLLDEQHYDIIHCHTPMGSVITRLAAGKARKYGTTVIYTAHGFHFFRGAPAVNWLVYYPVERLLARRTDLLITMNSEDYARARRFPVKRAELVHGVGLDLAKFTPGDAAQRAAVRAELGLAEGDIFAVSVANLIPRKNHIVLIRAVSKLKNPRLQLFICGEGTQEAELKQAVRDAGLERQIHFLGFREDIARLCGSADLFLFTSLQEGLPVAVMEAMACGLPIIASRIRGIVDLIEEGEGGWLADPTDADGFAAAMREALADPARCRTMAAHNLEKIDAYGTGPVLEEVTALYREYM